MEKFQKDRILPQAKRADKQSNSSLWIVARGAYYADNRAAFGRQMGYRNRARATKQAQSYAAMLYIKDGLIGQGFSPGDFHSVRKLLSIYHFEEIYKFTTGQHEENPLDLFCFLLLAIAEDLSPKSLAWVIDIEIEENSTQALMMAKYHQSAMGWVRGIRNNGMLPNDLYLRTERVAADLEILSEDIKKYLQGENN